MGGCYLGVDVGTGSARAGLFDGTGRLLGSAKQAIATWHEAGDIVEQSSDDIWAAVVAATRGALNAAGVTGDAVAGIGFDATCSLVLLGEGDRPVAVGAHGDARRNVIVWMDHRAMDQTRRINATGHAVLSYVGGVISPEMETPKLLWLAEELPAAFAAATNFLDLSDYLTYRATGSLQRSVCTVTCKWTYLAHERRWDESYFRQIGLGILADEGFARIGTEIVDVGTPLGQGLTAAAAEALGLRAGTPVGAALIDAHAGGLGTVGGSDAAGRPGDPRSRLGYISGTSACAMATTPEPVFVPGVWGPYYSAMLPGLWLNEGGQSAAGAAIDHLVRMHPGHAAATAEAERAGLSLLGWLERDAVARGGGLSEAARLAAAIHVVPEFLGNRSPGADPDARAVVAGLDLDEDAAALTRLYVAGVCGLGYGARQIIAALGKEGVPIDTMVMSGGAGNSAFFRQVMADTTGVRVAVPDTQEPVLLGAAMLGAVASGAHKTLPDAMSAMSRLGKAHEPGALAGFHAAKFKAFEALQDADRETRRLMGQDLVKGA
jgi:D-ribulokinase